MQGRGKTVLGCTIDTIDVSIVSMPELRVCAPKTNNTTYLLSVLLKCYTAATHSFHSHCRPIFTFYLVQTHVVQA